jgi:predicted double-glycine peptidase
VNAAASRITSCCALILCLILLSNPAEAGPEGTAAKSSIRETKPRLSLREMRTRHVITQEYDFSCGAAAIATLLTYYFGEPATEKEVIVGIAERADFQKVMQRRAFSLLDMKRFAEAKGYQAIGYKMDFEFLVDLNQPVIVPVIIRSYKHFVIFKGLVEDRVVIADPAFGNYTKRVGQFLDIWENGVGFILKRRVPKGPMTDEDLARQARFMPSQMLNDISAASRYSTFTPIPGRVQSITGPRPPGGSVLEFFDIRVPGVPSR